MSTHILSKIVNNNSKTNCFILLNKNCFFKYILKKNEKFNQCKYLIILLRYIKWNLVI